MDSISISHFMLAVSIVWVGSAVQASIGMGLNLIAIPLLFLINPVFVPGPVLLASLLLTILAAYRMPVEVNFNELKPAFGGLLLGTLGAALIIQYIDLRTFELIAGLIVVTAVALITSGRTVPVSRTALRGAGFSAGVLGTIAGVHAPPIALIYQSRRSSQFRGAILIFVGIGNFLSILALAIAGYFWYEQILASIILFPGIVLGLLGAPLLVKVFSEKSLRTMVLLVSGAGGVLLVARPLLP